MTDHSSIVGGSTAGRVLACPGSVQAIWALPKQIDAPSVYAEEGTFAHACMEKIMQARERGTSMTDAAAMLTGQKVYDRTVTVHHLEELLFPAIDALQGLERLYGGHFKVAAIELRAPFPGIIGSFGTIDLVLVSPKVALHVDWKFGAGVPVMVEYDHPDGGTLLNPQIAYYIAACRSARHDLYSYSRTIVGAIIQPRSETPVTHTTVSLAELRHFEEDLHNAVIVALRHDPPRSKGDHCRWAACKVNCPLWTGPLLELADLKPVHAPTPVHAPPSGDGEGFVTAYADYLSKAKALIDTVSALGDEVETQIHAILTGGGTVPGWKLRYRTKVRQWIDEKEVEAALKKLKFKPDEIWQKKLVTFTSADATAKRRKVKIPDNLRVAPPPTETVICPDTENAPPVVDRETTLRMFQDSLKQLTAEAASK